ncbi:MAG: FAD-dependent oxidoreductase [Planctomycetota bacterium]
MSNPNPRYSIVGGGLAGALMATMLGQDGHKVDVYEKRPDPRAAGADAGRSINLALSERGISGLRDAGLERRILDIAIPMYGREIHSEAGELSFQPYGVKDTDAINSVSRAELNRVLLQAADDTANVTLHFNSPCLDVDPVGGVLTVANPDGPAGSVRTIRDSVIIGADGAFSAVRSRMQLMNRFDYSQTFLATGYKELHIPPGPSDTAGSGDSRWRIKKNALHIWPRGDYMMIALPNLDGSFTVTLFWPFEGPHSFDAVQTDEQVRDFFAAHFADSLPHMPDLVETYQANPTSSLVTVRCGPWVIGDKVALIGDAAHAVVPFYGQGINCGFEDCRVLRACLKEHAGDRAAAFAAYYAVRKRNTDALADMCIENFIEMRDHTASPVFRVRKRIEKTLAGFFPEAFRTQYHLVSFTNVPYAEARQRGRRQQQLIELIGRGAVLIALLALLAIVATIVGG